MNKEIAVNDITFIQKGTQIEGSIESVGKVHISGSLKGNIEAKKHVIVNLEGCIHGDIHTQRAEISGELHGNIRVSDLLTLKSSARIFGNIYAKFLVTEEGSIINGKIHSGKDVDFHKDLSAHDNQPSIPQRKAG